MNLKCSFSQWKMVVLCSMVKWNTSITYLKVFGIWIFGPENSFFPIKSNQSCLLNLMIICLCEEYFCFSCKVKKLISFRAILGNLKGNIYFFTNHYGQYIQITNMFSSWRALFTEIAPSPHDTRICPERATLLTQPDKNVL